MKIKIKDVAKEKKTWSLYRLAKELSLPQQTVYSWASGRTQPSYDNMDRLCDVLDCGVGELFEAEMVFDPGTGGHGHVHASSVIEYPNTPATLIWCLAEQGLSVNEVIEAYRDAFDVAVGAGERILSDRRRANQDRGERRL